MACCVCSTPFFLSTKHGCVILFPKAGESVKLSKLLQKAAERLPGRFRLQVIWEYLCLLGRDPSYRNLLRLNLRAYFCIRPHYGPIRYKKVLTVPTLYHITEKGSLSSIFEKGLCNPVTRAVFLTDSPTRAFDLGARKHLSQPILLEINSVRMLADGHEFFSDEKTGHFWITEKVPTKYITASK